MIASVDFPSTHTYGPDLLVASAIISVVADTSFLYMEPRRAVLPRILILICLPCGLGSTNHLYGLLGSSCDSSTLRRVPTTVFLEDKRYPRAFRLLISLLLGVIWLTHLGRGDNMVLGPGTSLMGTMHRGRDQRLGRYRICGRVATVWRSSCLATLILVTECILGHRRFCL